MKPFLDEDYWKFAKISAKFSMFWHIFQNKHVQSKCQKVQKKLLSNVVWTVLVEYFSPRWGLIRCQPRQIYLTAFQYPFKVVKGRLSHMSDNRDTFLLYHILHFVNGFDWFGYAWPYIGIAHEITNIQFLQ